MFYLICHADFSECFHEGSFQSFCGEWDESSEFDVNHSSRSSLSHCLLISCLESTTKPCNCFLRTALRITISPLFSFATTPCLYHSHHHYSHHLLTSCFAPMFPTADAILHTQQPEKIILKRCPIMSLPSKGSKFPSE